MAGLGLILLAAAALYLFRPRGEGRFELTLTAGSSEGTRALLAAALADQSKARTIALRVIETKGSEEALDLVNRGACDLALVQGGLKIRGRENVRQVTALHVEPLHLLVKAAIEPEVAGGLVKLEGRRINLGEAGSGTYCLGSAVLSFAGLAPGSYVAESRSYHELLAEEDAAALPDAILSVSTLPSRVARRLVEKHGYRLVGLPFAEAFALSALDEAAPVAPGDPAAEVRREYAYDTVVPAFTYGVAPGVPEETTHTLGTRLLLVARAGVADEAISRLLEVVFNSRFSQVVYPPLLPELLDLPPELEPHAGTTAYLKHNQPLIAGDFVDLAEKWFSIAGVSVGGLVCLWQWLRRRARVRRDRGFESYILEVADIERRGAEQEFSPTPELPALLGLRRELMRLKQEALERFAAGDLEGEALVSGFLAHVNDTSAYLTRLILHQRENLEDAARSQGRTAAALWDEASKSVETATEGLAIGDREGGRSSRRA